MESKVFKCLICGAIKVLTDPIAIEDDTRELDGILRTYCDNDKCCIESTPMEGNMVEITNCINCGKSIMEGYVVWDDDVYCKECKEEIESNGLFGELKYNHSGICDCCKVESKNNMEVVNPKDGTIEYLLCKECRNNVRN
jgi:hypothetical protein